MPSVPFEVTPQRDLVQKPNGLGKLKPRSPISFLLIAIFLIALLLRVGVAIHFPSIEWGDEIFNSLEPAHHLAYGYGIVVWEWRMGIRSWVFPAFLAGVMRATDWMAPGSAGYLRAIAILLSLLSLTTVWFGYVWAKRAGGNAAAMIAAGACAIWYELVYFAPKTLNDVVAGEPPPTRSLPWDVRRSAAGEKTALLCRAFLWACSIASHVLGSGGFVCRPLFLPCELEEENSPDVSRASPADCFFRLGGCGYMVLPFSVIP